MNELSIAIIIPTAGRSAELEGCLSSLMETNYRQFNISILVIDNNTEPSLSGAIQGICAKFPECIYLQCLRPGLTSARHMGLDESNADILCFVDDDVVFSRGWLESIYSTFREPSIALAGGPTIPHFSGSVPQWFWNFLQPSTYGGWCCTWLSLLDIGHDIDDINPNWVWGLNFAIRRKALLECGGFHIDLVPRQYMRWQGDGETGLTMKFAAKGYKAVYRQQSFLFHQCGADRLNPDYFAKRAYYQGVCNSYTDLRRTLRGEQPQDFAVQHDNPVQQASLLKRALRRSIRTIKTRLSTPAETPTSVSPWAATAADVRARCQHAEQEGYLFHQREAAADPALREWICRDNYFDVDLRDFAER